MKRQEIVEAFMGIELDNLNLSERDKKIAELYLKQVRVIEIADQFNLSKGRIGHIMSKLARFANIYRKNSDDSVYLKYLQEFQKKRMLCQKISISSLEPDFSRRMSALLESSAHFKEWSERYMDEETGQIKDAEAENEE